MWSISSAAPAPPDGLAELGEAVLERLSRVSVEGRARALVVHGPAGAGHEALGRWVLEVTRSAQGDGIEVVHGPLSSPGDGLAGSLIQEVGLGALEAGPPLGERLAEALPRHALGDEDDAWALGGLAWPLQGHLHMAQMERLALLERLLNRRAQRRPFVVQLYDAQWGPESLDLVCKVLRAQQERPFPMLLVLNIITNASWEGAPTAPLDLAAVREALRPHGGAWEIALSPTVIDDVTDRLLEALTEVDVGERAVVRRLALLGGRAAGGEWQACRPRSLPPETDQVFEVLAALGLVEPWRGGWAMAPGVRDAVLQRPADDAAEHAEIAAGLDAHFGQEAVAERLVHHQLAAGQLEAARGCLLSAASLRRRSGQYEVAQHLLDRHDPIAESMGISERDPRRLLAALERATLLRVLGRLQEGMQVAEAAAKAIEGVELPHEVRSQILRVLAQLAMETDELDRAEVLLLRAHRLHDAGEVSESMAYVLRELAVLEERRGKLTEAEDYARSYLEVSEALGEPEHESAALARLGLVLRQQGKLEEALEAYNLAERRARALRYQHGLGGSLRGRAAVLRALGRLEESVEVLREARRVMEWMGNELGMAHCINGLAEAARKRGDLVSAEREYRRALELFQRLGSGQSIYPRINLGLVLLGRGLTRQAREQLELAQAHLEAAGRPGMLGAVLVTLLPCLVADREWAAWENHYQRATNLLADSKMVDADIAWAAELSGDWSEVGAKRSVDLSRAARSYEIALQQWMELGDTKGVTRVQLRLIELARAGSPIPLGPFDLERCEGAGGTGEVWVGTHRAQGVDVAVKVLTSAVAREPEVIAAFRDEVRAVAGLDHPNVIIVLDYGGVSEAASLMSEGRLVAESPYLAMEFCDAGTLSALCGRCDWQEAKRVLRSLLDALAHSHARGVVHRDLKPGNVLLERASGDRPQVKLSDFGIAHALGGGPRRRMVVGTPEYMAPEQFRGDWRNYGPWTDLYALGCIATALVSGRPPFSAATPEALAQAHWLQEPPPLRPRMPVPAGFEAWVRRLLAKSPRDRYRRASDAAWGLAQLGQPDRDAFTPPDEDDVSLGTVVTFVLDDIEFTEEEPNTASHELREVKPTPVVAPPAPVNWRPLTPPPPPLALRGAGLALYGLRSIPVVGREVERDRLWASLLSVVASEQPRTVLLNGPAGFGKTRLASWLGEQAHALGMAELMRVELRDKRRGALVRAMAAQAHCEGLEGEPLRRQLESWMRGRGVSDAARWEGLARIFEVAGESGALAPEDAELLREELLAIAGERVLVVLLEGVHWARHSLEVLLPLLQRDRAPVLVIMTARDDLLIERPDIGAVLEGLRQDRAFAELTVGALRQEHRTTLVKALLDLEEGLAQQVAHRTGGNLRFAMELIRDWVDRDLLQVGEAGFHLRPGARTPLPPSLHLSWVERVQRAVDRHGEVMRAALECLACAGSETVRGVDWRDACARMMLEYSVDIANQLKSEALVRKSGSSWSLVHSILRESLERVAEEEGRAQSYRRAWAQLLSERGRDRDRARIGMLLMRAGEPERAIDPVREAVASHLAHGRPDEVSTLVEVWEEALRALGVGEADGRWGELWLSRAQMSWEQGYYKETARHAERLLSAARRYGWDNLVAPALRLTAKGLEAQGELDESWSSLVDAREIHRYRGERDGVAHCMADLGSLARGMGRLDEGMEYFEEALEEFDRIGDDMARGRVLAGMAGICLGRGDYEAAEAYFHEGLQAYMKVRHRSGEAEMRNGLGEVHRYRDEAEEAERQYRISMDMLRTLGSAKALVPQLNLGLVLLQRGRFEEAEALFDQARPLVERRGRHEVRQFLEAFLLAAADPRDRDWAEKHRQVSTMLRDGRMAQPDMAWPLEVAAERAARLGRPEHAKRLFQLALDQWERLEADEAVARVVRRSSELGLSVLH
ncbi:MAG: tetratricopeptide repeat protein [Alphaproteobacteria bacterium]|nr:tetratricopeptide repeat protein [Alphaproteobacteria bacterium]